LRAPLYGAATLILAAGVGRPISGAIANCIVRRPRRVRQLLAALITGLIVSAALSSGRQVIDEHLAVRGLLSPPAGARNAVLVVWDTVRASSLSLYDFP
jgi:hypothetical protein